MSSNALKVGNKPFDILQLKNIQNTNPSKKKIMDHKYMLFLFLLLFYYERVFYFIIFVL